VSVHRPTAEAGGQFLGVLQRTFALFKTSAMIPKDIVTGRITLDRLPTAGTFLPVEGIAELHHTPPAGRVISLWQAFLTRPFHHEEILPGRQ
jgi:hypothetical protein